MSNNNSDFIKEMIGIFITQMPEEINSMKENFETGNFEVVKKIAHTIKPSYDYLGMETATDDIKKVEKMNLFENNLEYYKELINNLKASTNEATTNLAKEPYFN